MESPSRMETSLCLIQPSPQLCLTYLSQQVPDPHNTAQGQAHEILGVKLVIHYFWKKTEKSDLGQAGQLPFPCRAEMSDSIAGEPRAQCSRPKQGDCTHGTHVQTAWEGAVGPGKLRPSPSARLCTWTAPVVLLSIRKLDSGTA